MKRGCTPISRKDKEVASNASTNPESTTKGKAISGKRV